MLELPDLRRFELFDTDTVATQKRLVVLQASRQRHIASSLSRTCSTIGCRTYRFPSVGERAIFRKWAAISPISGRKYSNITEVQ